MNPLTNILTPQIRGVLYAVLFVAAIGFSAWQAADGDWVEFAGGLVTALLGATAASNASFTPTDEVPEDVPAEVAALEDDIEEDPDDSLPDTSSIHGGDGTSRSNLSGGNDYGY